MAYEYTLDLFNEIRIFVNDNNIKSQIELKRFITEGKFPKNLPSAYRDYPEKFKEHFISWKDLFNKNKEYISYSELRLLCQPYNFQSVSEFYNSDFFKNHDRLPNKIIFKEVYKLEWVSWGDLFMNNYTSPNEVSYISYMDLKAIVNEIGIKTSLEWFIYYDEVIRADEELFYSKYERIPSHPQHHYKEWTSWGTFLNTGRVANTKKEFLPYEEAREYVRDVLKVNKTYEYRKLIIKGKLPNFLPKVPTYYAECKGWNDWFYKS